MVGGTEIPRPHPGLDVIPTPPTPHYPVCPLLCGRTPTYPLPPQVSHTFPYTATHRTPPPPYLWTGRLAFPHGCRRCAPGGPPAGTAGRACACHNIPAYHACAPPLPLLPHGTPVPFRTLLRSTFPRCPPPRAPGPHLPATTPAGGRAPLPPPPVGSVWPLPSAPPYRLPLLRLDVVTPTIAGTVDSVYIQRPCVP